MCNKVTLALIVLAFIAFSACTRVKTKETVLRVNDYQMSLGEFTQKLQEARQDLL